MPNLRQVRISLWWCAVIAALIALVGAVAANTLTRGAVFAYLGLLGTGVTLASIEHHWFRAPRALGFLPRILALPRIAAILIAIWAPLFLIGYWLLPQSSFIYVKPGVVLNPHAPNSTWWFVVVVRGAEPLYNVTLVIEDATGEEERQKKLATATTDEERLRLVPPDPTTIHYQELDPSPVAGTDREVASFFVPFGLRRQLKYFIVMSHRRGTFVERLQINTPEDRDDWQYRMRVDENGDSLINCRDPRFPVDPKEPRELPQCFPEFQGRLPRTQ